MANPAHRSILHPLTINQMIVNGVLMRERKDLVKTLNDETGVEESHLTHTRVIGDKSYTSTQSMTDGEEWEEVIETNMDDSQLENFKNEWKEKWTPFMWMLGYVPGLELVPDVDLPGIAFYLGFAFGVKDVFKTGFKNIFIWRSLWLCLWSCPCTFLCLK